MTDILERNYIVPLRREFLKSPKYKRSKKAITALKEFMVKHMKSDDILISEKLNLHIWKNGIKNPPHKVSVLAVKDKEGKVTVTLEGEVTKAPEKETKKAPAKKEEKAEEKAEEKKEEAPKAEPKPEAKEEAPKKEAEKPAEKAE